ncbi:MAG: SMP-30/gluconolactonase/LRE family protein [Actinomycetota bacterium]
MRRTAFALLLLLLSVAAVPAATPAGGPPPVGQTSVFARIGEPGSPEGIVVRGDVVYVGTHVSVRGNAGGPPSRIFTFHRVTGAATGSVEIQGQQTQATHGILAMEFGPDGALYVVDRNPGRIVRIDTVSGAQSVYATIPDLAPCAVSQPPCAPGLFAQEPTFADYLAFGPAGEVYVTDLQASTIFRVPPGGGLAAIWYQDARFDSIFGLNGIVVDPAGTTLYFAMTGSLQPDSPLQGVIYTLPIVPAPQASDLAAFHTFLQPAAGPDGIAFGASGKLYVALAGAGQVAILNPDGSEAAIFPDPVANQVQEIPYDLPASVAFDGQGSLLVTNQSFFAGNAEHWAVLRAWVADTAA